MAKYTLQLLADNTILLETIYPGFAIEDAYPLFNDVMGIFNAATQPLHYIMDFSLSALELGEVMFGAHMVSSGENPLFQHKNIRSIIFVSPDKFYHMISEGMKSDVYGNLSTCAFNTLEEALEYIRAQK